MKDEGPHSKGQISWGKMYPLLVAGGLFHFTVDITFETKNWWSWGIESAPWKANISQFIINLNEYQTDAPNLGIVFSILILGLFLVINLVYQKVELKKDIKPINAMVLGVVALYTIPLAIFGNGIMGHEPDLGAMGYFLIFFFLPIGLCELSLMPVKDENAPIKEYNAQKAEFKLKIVVRFFFTLAGIFLLVVIVFAIDSMNNFNTFLAEANDSIRNFFENYFIYLALGVTLLAILFILVGILLQRRAKYAQRIAMGFFVLTGIAMFPLIFWGLLRETEVIALFETNTSIKGNKQEK